MVEEKRYKTPRRPKSRDYANGDADILTGEWN